jgi:hypothetical protein
MLAVPPAPIIEPTLQAVKQYLQEQGKT